MLAGRGKLPSQLGGPVLTTYLRPGQEEALGRGEAIDGGTARYTTINHVIGQKEGTVEIDFSSGYPADRPVVLTVDAIMGGQRIGTGSTMLVPAADCDTPTVDVAASG